MNDILTKKEINSKGTILSELRENIELIKLLTETVLKRTEDELCTDPQDLNEISNIVRLEGLIEKLSGTALELMDNLEKAEKNLV